MKSLEGEPLLLWHINHWKKKDTRADLIKRIKRPNVSRKPRLCILDIFILKIYDYTFNSSVLCTKMVFLLNAFRCMEQGSQSDNPQALTSGYVLEGIYQISFQLL